MKKYILKILLMGISLILPFVLYYSYVQSLPSYGDNSIGGTIRYKIDLIKETEGERIILVGGSSSPYGTICDEFEKEFERPCINIGATAYLGIEYYLNILEKYAKEGDIIVIAPEHILLKGQSIDYTTMWIAVGNDRDALKCIPVSYYKGMFSAFNGYSKLKIADKNTPKKNIPHPHFGPKGDVILERESLLEKGYNTEDIISLNADEIYYDNLKLINDYCIKAEEYGRKVFFAFAPVNNLAISTDDVTNAIFENTISEYIYAPVVLDLDTAIMESKYFYDTNNHLTTAGAEIYTEKLIKGLKEALN